MKLSDMKIYIICLDNDVYKCLIKQFGKTKNVSIYKGYFDAFMDEHESEVECIVSPANSYGYMTGGFDAAISDYFGWGFQSRVQKYIIEHFYGEQPVGTSFIIKDNNTKKKLIHTPTMRVPSIIKDPFIVYQCMRSTLICALDNNVKSIVIPPFGGGCGRVSPNDIAKNMKDAYDQILTKRRERKF